LRTFTKPGKIEVMSTKMPKAVMDFFREAGSSGGKKAASNMTAEQRSERAKKASVKAAEGRTKKATAKKAAVKKAAKQQK
jgi:hypothetical protein